MKSFSIRYDRLLEAWKLTMEFGAYTIEEYFDTRSECEEIAAQEAAR